jgi:hypothetical protein
MDKEMESSLRQMMARFLAEMNASYAEMETRAEARQEKADAKVEARLQRSLAFLGGLMSSEERTTICRVPPVACSANSEGDVITSEESSEEIEAMNLEATPERNRPQWSGKTSLKKIYTLTISGHQRTDLDIDAWSCGVAEGLRSSPKTVLDTGRRSLLPASE